MGDPHVKAVYEDMVAVLLSTLHPEAERLDGRGGDGGRDIQLRHHGRLDLFELKSFTGRLSKQHGRRRQVEDSLKTAARHNPDSWTLVVPIDHTKDELAWFDRLRSQYPFPLIWRGRTWLDQQVAVAGRRPIIPISDAVDRSVTFGRRGNHRVGPCRAGLANGSLGR